MNIENLKKLRDAVAQTTEFNMESYCVPGEFRKGNVKLFDGDRKEPYCRTPSCLAGHCVALQDTQLVVHPDSSESFAIFSSAKKWLKLNQADAWRLFASSSFWRMPLLRVSKERALNVLDYMIRTGHMPSSADCAEEVA